MTDLTIFPDLLTLLRTAIALPLFFFLPGYLFYSMRLGGVFFFKKKILDLMEWLELFFSSVVLSVLTQILLGLLLVFTIGLTVLTAFAANALLLGASCYWLKKNKLY